MSDTYMDLFETEHLGSGISIVKHKITGDCFVYGGPTGIPAEHAEYWKRNYFLPVVNSIRTQNLPTNGGQLDYKLIEIEDLKRVRLVSHIQEQEYESCVSSLYGRSLTFSDQFFRLSQNKSMVIARYTGPRIDLGMRVMPEGGKMDFYLMRVLVEHTVSGE